MPQYPEFATPARPVPVPEASSFRDLGFLELSGLSVFNASLAVAAPSDTADQPSSPWASSKERFRTISA
jgi:hypothetical protein